MRSGAVAKKEPTSPGSAVSPRRDGATLPPYTALADVPLVLNLRDCARLVRMSERHCRELADAGELPGRRAGRDWRFSRDAVLAWLAGSDRDELLRWLLGKKAASLGEAKKR